MSLSFPYTYISCPCSDNSRQTGVSGGEVQVQVIKGDDENNNSSSSSSNNNNNNQEENEGEREAETERERERESGFDPRHPRSAYSLFPPEHLLYCEECHEIKCPRCVKEEILCWYCPYCLFETPSSTVRNEGNRCARNCFNCPMCMSQLVTASIGESSGTAISSSSSGSKDAGGGGGGGGGPFILNCNYCMWSTLDIGITFGQPTSMRAQLDRLANGGEERKPRADADSSSSAAAAAAAATTKSKFKSSLRMDSLGTSVLSSSSSTSTQINKEDGKDEDEDDDDNQDDDDEDKARDKEDLSPVRPDDQPTRFTALRNFYKDQIMSTSTHLLNAGGAGGLLPTTAAALDMYYSSPSSLARIMNLYSVGGGGPAGSAGGAGAGFGIGGMKKGLKQGNDNKTPPVMREARTRSEGIVVLPSPSASTAAAAAARTEKQVDYIDTPTLAQLQAQHPCSLGSPGNINSNNSSSSRVSVSDLRPMPALLRTKRSKRCATCSHILVRPEFKPTSTRYRIKLLALNYIPFVTFRPLLHTGGSGGPAGPGGGGSIDGEDIVLEPGKATQWVLTMRNPLYENVNVTLAAEGLTPGSTSPSGPRSGRKGQGQGRPRHRVTILCPEFEVGKNGDVWDDALGVSDLGKSSSSSASASASASVSGRNHGGGDSSAGEGIAGKIYERGRNWVSVIVEIVPGFVERAPSTEVGDRDDDDDDDDDDEEEEEDIDVIEVPIRVRLEWRQSEGEDEGGIGGGATARAVKAKKSKSDNNKSKAARLLDEGLEGEDEDSVLGDDGRREVAYWMVLGVGRVRR